MDNEKLNKERYYEKKDFMGQKLSNIRNNNVLPYIQGVLVDLGCGDGQMINAYEGKSIGVDIEDYGIADIVIKNFNKIPIDSASIDTVTIIASLNYFEDPQKVINECYRMLKNHGQLIMTMPNKTIMKIWHMFREKWAHRSGFNQNELKAICKKAGFILSKKAFFMLGVNSIFVFKKAAR